MKQSIKRLFGIVFDRVYTFFYILAIASFLMGIFGFVFTIITGGLTIFFAEVLGIEFPFVFWGIGIIISIVLYCGSIWLAYSSTFNLSARVISLYNKTFSKKKKKRDNEYEEMFEKQIIEDIKEVQLILDKKVLLDNTSIFGKEISTTIDEISKDDIEKAISIGKVYILENNPNKEGQMKNPKYFYVNKEIFKDTSVSELSLSVGWFIVKDKSSPEDGFEVFFIKDYSGFDTGLSLGALYHSAGLEYIEKESI